MGWLREDILRSRDAERIERSRSALGKKEGYHHGTKAYRWEKWVARASSVVTAVTRRRSLLLASRGRSQGGTG